MADEWFKRIGRLSLGDKETFRFERELALFVFRTWIIWPGPAINSTNVSRLLAQAITLQKCSQLGRLQRGRIESLSELQDRISSAWYRQFFKQFV